MTNIKPYKVQDVTNKYKKGIVAKSLAEVQWKGAKTLDLPKDCSVYLEDGTEISDEDYFETLPSQTVFVLAKPGQSWGGYVKHAIEKVFKAISQPDQIIIEQIKDWMTGDECAEMYAVMAAFLNRLEENVDAEEREKDKAWFEGVTASYRTKEDVMRNGAQSRIRNYLATAKEYVEREGTVKSKPLLLSALSSFQQQLKKDHYFADYFARSGFESLRFCSGQGLFDCEGLYNMDQCKKIHKINPYGSREGRILFSTWNLDHIIEKSRSILPAMLKAAQDCPRGSQLNWKYFYRLLFTRENLKLVHIGCHYKGEHEGYVCSRKHFYEKKKSS